MQGNHVKTVLVADDNSANRELIAAILERSGFRVEGARDGQEALEKMSAAAPDLVLLDIHMPRCDGYQTIAAIRKDERTHKLPVVALTASAMAGDAETALQQGFDAYLAKPYEISAILSLVRKLLDEE